MSPAEIEANLGRLRFSQLGFSQSYLLILRGFAHKTCLLFPSLLEPKWSQVAKSEPAEICLDFDTQWSRILSIQGQVNWPGTPARCLIVTFATALVHWRLPQAQLVHPRS